MSTAGKWAKTTRTSLCSATEILQSAAFRTEDPQGYAEDINSYLKAGAGKLGVNHEKVLVFAKGDPEKAAETIGTPETAEEADRYDNTALLKEILGEDTGDE